MFSSTTILAIELPNGSALSSDSKALCVSALELMLDRWRWQKMSDTEWDLIEALVSDAISEVISDEA